MALSYDLSGVQEKTYNSKQLINRKNNNIEEDLSARSLRFRLFPGEGGLLVLIRCKIF